MKRYEHKRECNVGFCDVDFKDELKPSVLLQYFEEAACSSADELGFGYDFCKPRGYAFMLTEVRVEFLRQAKLGEGLTVSTWPLTPSFVVFRREYLLRAKEEILARASSRWCLVDLQSGKILQSKAVEGQDYDTYRTDKALDEEGKIPRFDSKEGRLAFSMTVANSEYDHNMHVNNTRYADYCFNCFSVDELSKKTLKSFSIAYMKQCREGEFLRFYRKDEENVTLLCGVNESDEQVVRATVRFV